MRQCEVDRPQAGAGAQRGGVRAAEQRVRAGLARGGIGEPVVLVLPGVGRERDERAGQVRAPVDRVAVHVQDAEGPVDWSEAAFVAAQGREHEVAARGEAAQRDR